MKLTIVVLISLAATSIVGTVIPQNEDPTAYVKAYGPFLYRVFDVLDLFDMYHSWWFQLLLLLLTANLTICSIERLRTTWKIIFVKDPIFHISRFRKLPHKAEFGENRSPEKLIRLYDQFMAKRFSYSRSETTERGFCIYAEKGRLTRLGVYTVHLSVVLLLVGGLIGSLFGFEGYMNVPEGESSQTVQLRNSAAVQQLGFEIRCDDFKVSFYENGSRKEFRSTLTILQQGKPVLTKDIIVNDPLGYRGIRIFQSSYGPLGPESVTLDFKSNATGMIYSKKVKIGQQFDIPEKLGKFVIREYSDRAEYQGHKVGDAFYGIYISEEGKTTDILLPVRFPSFDKMRKGNFFVSVANYDNRYYTGLQITRDPGVWVVYIGFVVMILGCTISFFMSHQQVCVEIIKAGQQSSVVVAGSANKNKYAMQTKIKSIAQRLADIKA